MARLPVGLCELPNRCGSGSSESHFRCGRSSRTHGRAHRSKPGSRRTAQRDEEPSQSSSRQHDGPRRRLRTLEPRVRGHQPPPVGDQPSRHRQEGSTQQGRRAGDGRPASRHRSESILPRSPRSAQNASNATPSPTAYPAAPIEAASATPNPMPIATTPPSLHVVRTVVLLSMYGNLVIDTVGGGAPGGHAQLVTSIVA